jgi:enoyl-CoA hydratase/carnithine racemase
MMMSSQESQEPRGGADAEVVTERRGPVLVVRINRPQARNAFNVPVMAGIGNALLEADRDAEIRAVVLTGTGDRAFCAGMDLRAFAAGGAEPDVAPRAGIEAFGRFTSGGGCDKPVICAAQATALAGGFELVREVHAELQRSVFASADAKEGASAFVERRAPVWQGR